MRLRTLRPKVRPQWTVLLIPQVLVNFINKLSDVGAKNNHAGQAQCSVVATLLLNRLLYLKIESYGSVCLRTRRALIAFLPKHS